jgi:hypothetical protein
MHVNSNNEKSTDGIVMTKINRTTNSLCSIGISLLENKIAKHKIAMVMKYAIAAYLDCGVPKKTSPRTFDTLAILL